MMIRKTNQGGTILVMLILTTIFIGLAATMMSKTSNLMNSTYQNPSWSEALYVAESGLDIAMHEIRRTGTDNKWNFTSTQLTGNLPARDGEGGGNPPEYRVTISKVPGQDNFYKVRSTGIVNAPGSQRRFSTGYADSNGVRVQDRLRNFFYVRKNTNLSAQPATWRSVEAYVQRTDIPGVAASPTPTPTPTATPMPTPTWGKYAFFMKNVMRLQSENAYIDSYDSTDPTKSTNGLYDPAKRQQNGHVATTASNGSVELYGKVYGNVQSNANLIKKSVNDPRQPNNSYVRATGTVTSPFSESMPNNAVPNWEQTGYTTKQDNGNSPNYAVGTLASPTKHIVTNVGGNITFTLPSGQTSGAVELWVKSNVNGASIVIPNNVMVTMYVTDNVSFNSANNISKKPINFKILGVRQNGTSAFNCNFSEFYGIIYAPQHEFNINGGKWFGAIGAYSTVVNGNAEIHYDESIARNGGSASSPTPTPTPTPTPGTQQTTSTTYKYTVTKWAED